MSHIIKLPAPRNAMAVRAMREYKTDLSADNGVLPRIDENTRLVPLDACHAIVEKIEAEYQSAGEGKDTTNAVAFLLGGYPQSVKSADGMENPKIYMAHVVRIFAKYPATLHAKATDEILSQYKFKPAIAEITEVFEKLVGKWTYAQIIARKHIKEHERRKAEAERTTLIEAEAPTREEFSNEMSKKYGIAAVNMARAAQGEKSPKTTKPFDEKAENEADLKRFGEDRRRLDEQIAALQKKVAE
jgi:hypothetical protein